MALNLKAKAYQSTSISRVGDGNDTYVRAIKDGSLVFADWKQAAIMAGHGFMVNMGTLSTPIAGAGGTGTVIDIDRPDLVVSVPNGTCLLPLRAEVTGKVPLLATDADESEILITVDQDKAWDATGTSTALTVYNMNTLVSLSSACTARKTFSATTTDPVHDIDLSHVQITGDVQGTAATALWTPLYMLYEPKNPPIINGPAMVIFYWGGTVATSAFVSFQWLELPESAFTLS